LDEWQYFTGKIDDYLLKRQYLGIREKIINVVLKRTESEEYLVRTI
jgi:hypothetical protein